MSGIFEIFNLFKKGKRTVKMMSNQTIEEFIDIIQDGHINFLLGSGLSKPYLNTLGNIEKLLTELESIDLEKKVKQYIEVSIKKKFFDGVVSKNYDLVHGDKGAEEVLVQYQDFLRIWMSILLERKSSLLNKRANLFTSNYDVFLEKSLENINVDFNDGFNGRFVPIFSTGNFSKTYSQKSLHFDNISEIPHFNLIKIHGSLTWELNLDNDKIQFSNLKSIKELKKKSDSITGHCVISDDLKSIEDLIASHDMGAANYTPQMEGFLEEYKKLAVVNPTKAKFRETLLDKNYYDLLRILSNELEKENAVLFILGFSMSDEHVKQIIIRAVETNPTLMVYVFAYDEESKVMIEKNMGSSHYKYENFKYIVHVPRDNKDTTKYDFKRINDLVFSRILRNLPNAKHE